MENPFCYLYLAKIILFSTPLLLFSILMHTHSQTEKSIDECCDILDSHLKMHKLYIYGHVECNVAVMKGKDVATLMPSRAPQPDYSSASCERADGETCPDNQPLNDLENGNPNVVEEGESSIPSPSQGPCWFPLQWRAGFPRDFSLSEIEVITNGFADIIYENEEVKIY